MNARRIASRPFLLASFIAAAVVAVPADARRAREAPLALVGATVIDGTGGPPLTDATVLIENGRIKAVGPRSKVKIPKGCAQVDLRGRFIVPGLVDAHVHFFQSGGLYTRPDAVDLTSVRPYASEAAAIRADLQDTFLRYLVNGVTAVIDFGGPMWNFEVRSQSESVDRAPRVAATGPLLSTVARPQLGYGDPPDLPIVRVESPAAARAMVKAQVARAPAFIKYWFVLTPDRTLAESLAILDAIVAEAHAAKVRVAVHATELETARAAVKAGCDVLVHSVQDKEVDDDFVRLLKERKVTLVPTLVVLDGYASVAGTPAGKSPSELEKKYGAPAALTSWAEWSKVSTPAAREAGEKRRARVAAAGPIMAANLRKLVAAGVTIAAGTDAGNIGTVPGASMHDELSAMVRAGMSPRDVLVAATRNAAAVFAPRADFGAITAGMRADLLVVRADPLADIANLREIEAVYQDGTGHSPDELLPPNPVWVVDRQIDAYNRGDVAAFLATYAADATLYESPGGAAKMTGHKEMGDKYGTIFASSPTMRCTILSRVAQGNMVVDHELITGRDGKPYFHGIAIYEVEGGLIRRVWFGGVK